MRIGSSSISQNKPASKNNVSKGIQEDQFKKFNPNIVENFSNLSGWVPLRGSWSTDGSILTTGSSASQYPILTSYDIRSQNILATMSLDSAGPGVVFWLLDENNWWAGVTFYVQNAETYIIRYDTRTVQNARCWGWDGTRAWGCFREVSTAVTGTRTRYNFYLKLIKSENGVVSDVTNILLRSTCSISTSSSPCTQSTEDNINGVQVSTLNDVITVRGRNNNNNFYGSAISYTAPNPNKGHQSGVVFTPGSNYLLSSVVQNISIEGR